LWAPSFFLAVSILLAAFLSSAISHRAYWREIFFKAYGLIRGPFRAQFSPYGQGRFGRTDVYHLRRRTGENAQFLSILVDRHRVNRSEGSFSSQSERTAMRPWRSNCQ
jgi:hypothetical protein